MKICRSCQVFKSAILWSEYPLRLALPFGGVFFWRRLRWGKIRLH
jgi:hypothetical protein